GAPPHARPPRPRALSPRRPPPRRLGALPLALGMSRAPVGEGLLLPPEPHTQLGRRRGRPGPALVERRQLAGHRAVLPREPTRLQRAGLELDRERLALGLEPLPVLLRRDQIDVEGVQPLVGRGDRTRRLGAPCPVERERALLGRQALEARHMRGLELAQLAGAGEERLLERRLATTG